MFKEKYPYYLGNQPEFSNDFLEVKNKYTGEVVTKVSLANAKVIDQAISKAQMAFNDMRKMAPYERKEVLEICVAKMKEKREELAKVLAIEAGKALQHSRLEVTRCLDTFQIAAEESVRQYGEYQSLEISPYAKGYESIWKRVPIGPCSFIVPFNFPLNLAAHKIAPALAVGCSFVVKPASYTPISLLLIGEILSDTPLPKGAFSILPSGRKDAEALTSDERFKLLSFTGSPDVGWDLKAKAGKKKVVLELGGNAACIVDQDCDQEFATKRLTIGTFYQSGQSCISVQRIFIHEKIYSEMKERLISAAKELKMGDPLDEKTFLGPLISENDSKRMEEWVKEAVDKGGKILIGGKRNGVMFDATLLENVPSNVRLNCKEAFGPVAILESFSDFKKVIRKVNDSDFGLQAGIFTRDIQQAFYAFNEIEAGGIVINDVPSLRVDSMPYGGVKDSGLGREGVRFAMEDMSEIRLMVLNRIGQASSI